MMTPEQMNAAIDEWLHPNKSWPQNALKRANYCNSLDAVHEPENRLRKCEGLEWVQFHEHLIRLCGGLYWEAMHATALQRAEALCRTFWPERWKE